MLTEIVVNRGHLLPAGRGDRDKRVDDPRAGGRAEEAGAHDARGRGQVPARRLPRRTLAHHPPARAAPDIRRQGGTIDSDL